MAELASLVLFSGHFHAAVEFYRALGVDLTEEDHGSGPVHAAVELGGVHVAVFDAAADPGRAPAWRQAGSSFPGLWVDSLPDAVAAVTGRGAPVLVAHEARPWGCRAVVQDPDGRPVELNQRDHCDAPA